MSFHTTYAYNTQDALQSFSPNRMRLTIRKKYLTFWHYLRTPSYTESNRQKMAEQREDYLRTLKQYLDYELDSPQMAEGVLPPKPKALVPRKRVDSFVEEERRRVAWQVAEENLRAGAPKAKCVADQGEVSRMYIVAALPSCARDEADEEFAGGSVESDSGFMNVLAQGVKNVLGMK